MTPHETAILRDSACAEDRILDEGNARKDRVIRDDDVVEFEGELVKWGELTVQDRKAYMAGGYPY